MVSTTSPVEAIFASMAELRLASLQHESDQFFQRFEDRNHIKTSHTLRPFFSALVFDFDGLIPLQHLLCKLALLSKIYNLELQDLPDFA